MSAQPPHKRPQTRGDVVLPDDVIENVLSHLPVKEAHRVSVLSKRFRHSWKLCRDFSFDRDFAGNMSRNEFRKVITKILDHHHPDSAADRFRLYFDAIDDAKLVSYWIQRAVNLGIREIELDFSPSTKKFMLSYDLVDVEAVKTMKLVNCELQLPMTSNGLRHLREITIQEARARPIFVKAVFLNCMSLETFRLIKCKSVYDLKISAKELKGFKTLIVDNCFDSDSIILDAPSLRSLRYHGKICEFEFKSELPQLNDVVIEIANPRGFQVLHHRKDVVVSLASVRILTVSSTFLEGLTARYEERKYKEMDFNFSRLKQFELHVASESYLNPSDVANFLKKCPRVERVSIDLGQNAFRNGPYWNIHGRKYMSDWETVFPFMKYVEVKGFTLTEQAVTMTRFFLKTAIYLRFLALFKAKNYNFPEIFTPMCLCSGISSNANIQVYEHQPDATTV